MLSVGIGVIVAVLVTAAFCVLFTITFIHIGNEKTTNIKTTGKLPLLDDDEFEFYDPTEFDFGVPEFAEECTHDPFSFDIYVTGECFLRSSPGHEPKNIYGTLKDGCVIHAKKMYLCTIEDNDTFVGVESKNLKAKMVVPGQCCLTKFNDDGNRIVWFSEKFATFLIV